MSLNNTIGVTVYSASTHVEVDKQDRVITVTGIGVGDSITLHNLPVLETFPKQKRAKKKGKRRRRW